MKPEEFIQTITNILDTDKKLTLETELSDIEWDSVSMIAFYSAFAKELQNVKNFMERIESSKTLGDLYNIIANVK